MNSPGISDTVTAARFPADHRPAAPDGQLEVGGPIAVSTRPRDDISLGAAFYDQETDILSVNILPFEPYDSYVESDGVRIDTDRNGRPVFVEVARPWNQWRINHDLSLPETDFNGVVQLKDTLRRFPPGEVFTDSHRKRVCVKFLARQGDHVIRLAENILMETADGFLVALWIDDVQPDFAGRKQSMWRVSTAARLRESGRNWNPCTQEKLSQNSLQRSNP